MRIVLEGNTVTYRGRVEGGVVVLEQGAAIPDGTLVLVEPAPESAPTNLAPEDPLFRMGDLAEDTGVTDLATNIDTYLYGHPRPGNGQ
jgi:hypothetical protein